MRRVGHELLGDKTRICRLFPPYPLGRWDTYYSCISLLLLNDLWFAIALNNTVSTRVIQYASAPLAARSE